MATSLQRTLKYGTYFHGEHWFKKIVKPLYQIHLLSYSFSIQRFKSGALKLINFSVDLGRTVDFYVSAAHPVSGVEQWHALFNCNTFLCRVFLNIFRTFLSHFIMQMKDRSSLPSWFQERLHHWNAALLASISRSLYPHPSLVWPNSLGLSCGLLLPLFCDPETCFIRKGFSVSPFQSGASVRKPHFHPFLIYSPSHPHCSSSCH